MVVLVVLEHKVIQEVQAEVRLDMVLRQVEQAHQGKVVLVELVVVVVLITQAAEAAVLVPLVKLQLARRVTVEMVELDYKRIIMEQIITGQAEVAEDITLTAVKLVLVAMAAVDQEVLIQEH